MDLFTQHVRMQAALSHVGYPVHKAEDLTTKSAAMAPLIAKQKPQGGRSLNFWQEKPCASPPVPPALAASHSKLEGSKGHPNPKRLRHHGLDKIENSINRAPQYRIGFVATKLFTSGNERHLGPFLILQQPLSGVPRDSPLEGQSMWDFASITLGCAKRSLFYFILFYFFMQQPLTSRHHISRLPGQHV